MSVHEPVVGHVDLQSAVKVQGSHIHVLEPEKDKFKIILRYVTSFVVRCLNIEWDNSFFVLTIIQ